MHSPDDGGVNQEHVETHTPWRAPQHVQVLIRRERFNSPEQNENSSSRLFVSDVVSPPKPVARLFSFSEVQQAHCLPHSDNKMLHCRALCCMGLVVGVLGLACAHDLTITSQHGQQEDVFSRSTRTLQQQLQNSDTTLKYIDFSTLPADLPADNQTVADEKPLQGSIDITTNAINEPYSIQYGAFHLGPTEVDQITSIVADQLVRFSIYCEAVRIRKQACIRLTPRMAAPCADGYTW